MKCEDLESEIMLRQKHIESIKGEVQELKNVISDLRHEVTMKSDEIKQVKFEANQDIK